MPSMIAPGLRVTSPPTRVTPTRSAKSPIPSERALHQPSGVSSGSAAVKTNLEGFAAIAPTSEMFTASNLAPNQRGGWARVKWTPSTIKSTVITSPSCTAASSPGPSGAAGTATRSHIAVMNCASLTRLNVVLAAGHAYGPLRLRTNALGYLRHPQSRRAARAQAHRYRAR